MGEKINRVGEIAYNNFGSKMIISEYRTNKDIDVYFPQYNWTKYNTKYVNFKKGQINCPFEPRNFGVGFIGDGLYKSRENGKNTKCYDTWRHMLTRCYDKKYQEKYPTYIGCEVCKEWLNFQNFAKWYEDNYYKIEDDLMYLDKDILNKGNKIYSPQTCVFVNNRINVLFIKSDKKRGGYPIGVRYHKRDKIYEANCDDSNGKQIYLGRFSTPEEAFYIYKQFKEKVIKQVADEYKDKIPKKLYEAMYRYEVEITD